MGLNFLIHIVSVPPDKPRITQQKNAKIPLPFVCGKMKYKQIYPVAGNFTVIQQ